ncbi:MAG: hypothetical protein AB4038_18640 [Prochloraceae cyanobacterium]
MHTFRNHSEAVVAIVISPDGQTLVSSSRDIVSSNYPDSFDLFELIVVNISSSP